MPITRPSLEYLREKGTDGTSPADSFALDESSSERVLRVPWGGRYDAVRSLMGYSQYATDGGGNITHLQRLTPLPHADPTVSGMLYATRVPAIGGFKFDEKFTGEDSSVANTFEKAELTVGYEHLPYPVKEDYDDPGTNKISDAYSEWERFCYPSAVRPSAEYLSLPTGALRYTASGGTPAPPHGSPIPFGLGKVMVYTEVDVKWIGLPSNHYTIGTPSPWQKRIWGYPADAVKPLIGKVNKDQLWGWAPGTALLSNVTVEQHKHPVTGWSWDVTFTFTINTNGDGMGWNWSYYWGVGGVDSGWYFMGDGTNHYAPGSVPDGESLYDEANFLGADGLFDVTT